MLNEILISISQNRLRVFWKGIEEKRFSHRIERLNIQKGRIQRPSALYGHLLQYGLRKDPYGKLIPSNPLSPRKTYGGPAPQGLWNGFIKERKGPDRIELTEKSPRKWRSKADGMIHTRLGVPRTNIQIHPYGLVTGCIRYPLGDEKEFEKMLRFVSGKMKKGSRLKISIEDHFWETKIGKKLRGQKNYEKI